VVIVDSLSIRQFQRINKFNKMKNSIFTFTFLLLFQLANAQDKARFGVRAGVISAKQKTGSLSSPSLLSYSFGVLLDKPLSNQKISFQPNLLFTIKGGGATKTSSSINFIEAKYNYLELPANILFNLSEILSIGGGPYLAYALSGKVGEKEVSFDDNSSIKRIDYGYNLQAQINISKGFGLTLNYNKSFPNKNSVTNGYFGGGVFKMF
jgi:hypothetical protein